MIAKSLVQRPHQRLRKGQLALIEYLHDFAREVELTIGMDASCTAFNEARREFGDEDLTNG